jgi:hypothetical protein
MGEIPEYATDTRDLASFLWTLPGTNELRAARPADLQKTESDFDPLPFDAGTARAFGRVAGAL